MNNITEIEHFNLPEPKVAYLEAMNHSHEWRTYAFSHLAVREALRASNVTKMKSLPPRVSAKIYYINYKIICQKVIGGLPFEKEIPQAIEHDPASRLCTLEENRENMRKMREELGI